MTDHETPTATELAVGETGPEKVFEKLQRTDFVKYAGASGDFNPIHFDEQFAEMAGYDTVFAQGMLTAGFGSQAVTNWFGLAAMDAYSVRFESQVWPGDTVTAVPEITDIEQNGKTATVEVAVAVRNQDEEVVLRGEATATVPAE